MRPLEICFHLSFLIASLFVESEADLKLVNVVFRHGDRTPSSGAEMYPNDPYNDELFYPVGRGGLTNRGKKREFELGQFLRARYDEFLGKHYIPDVLKARSTDYDRTKMSLQLVLAALFPPQDIQKWKDNLDWQPIPYKYLPRLLDNLLIPEECPVYLNEMLHLLTLKETRKKLAKYSELMKKLTNHTGKPIKNPYDIYNLYLGLDAEASMNLTLPSWVTATSFPNGELLEVTLEYYDMFSRTTNLKKLNGGMLVKEILSNINNLQNKTASEKLYLYSGHETNIAALLQALGVYKPHVPEFSSAVIVELHELKEKYYVKVLYYRGIPAEIVPLQVPGCTEMCPLEKFKDILSDIVPSAEEQKCNKYDRMFDLDGIYKHFGKFN